MHTQNRVAVASIYPRRHYALLAFREA